MKGLGLKRIILTLFGFVVLWAAVTDMWGYSDCIFKNGTCNTGTYLYGYISRFTWVTPAVLLIIRHENMLRYNQKELFSPPRYDSRP